MTPEPIWISRAVADSVHAASIDAYGGSQGVRDEGLVESALARPRNRWMYDPTSDRAALAAAYAYDLARNHGYVDGNKRVAFAVMAVFLELNDLRLIAPEDEAYEIMVDVASGECSEEDLARWLRVSTGRTGDVGG